MWQTIRYQFGHLAEFRGRDTRQTFWYWFLALVVANVVVGLAMSLPLTTSAMGTAMAGARSGGDPAAVEAAAQAAMMNQMADSMKPLILAGIVVGLINIVLLGASFVRRLHDSGKSALWAGLAAAVYLVSLWASWASADRIVSAMHQAAAQGSARLAGDLQQQLGWQQLVGYVPLIIIIVFGVMKSDPGPNRYGEEPVRF
jgi:uncharacterized membrane protein YhaH (DUF805 family)